MENMERFTLLYTIAYAILNGMDNLHFDKEGYFHVLVFNGLFYKQNTVENTFFGIPIRYRNTRGSLGGLKIASMETLTLRARVPISISHSPKLPLVFLQMYGNMENIFYFLIVVRLHSIVVCTGT